MAENYGTGESQRKDGKYEYKYQDVFGKRRTVYSWTLTSADTTPKGKRSDLPLRENGEADSSGI